jgi:hypothetical protein
VPLCHVTIKKSIVLCVTVLYVRHIVLCVAVLYVRQCVVLELCDLRDLGPTGLL